MCWCELCCTYSILQVFSRPLCPTNVYTRLRAPVLRVRLHARVHVEHVRARRRCRALHKGMQTHTRSCQGLGGLQTRSKESLTHPPPTTQQAPSRLSRGAASKGSVLLFLFGSGLSLFRSSCCLNFHPGTSLCYSPSSRARSPENLVARPKQRANT